MSLQLNSKAPDFQLEDTEHKMFKLSDLLGQWVLLYFYPKDETPGCTAEACSFRDSFAELKKYLTIIGISADSVKSHQSFKEHHQLPFVLLADPEKTALTAYEVNGLIFPKRSSFLINPEGSIIKIYDRVNLTNHVAQILQDIKELKN